MSQVWQWLNQPALTYLLAAAGVIGLGVYGLLAADHLLRKLLALNLLGSGVLLLMVILPARGGTPDPVAHALVLTGLVVAVSVTAFALALLDRLYRETGEIRIDFAPLADAQAGGDTTATPPGAPHMPNSAGAAPAADAGH